MAAAVIDAGLTIATAEAVEIDAVAAVLTAASIMAAGSTEMTDAAIVVVAAVALATTIAAVAEAAAVAVAAAAEQKWQHQVSGVGGEVGLVTISNQSLATS